MVFNDDPEAFSRGQDELPMLIYTGRPSEEAMLMLITANSVTQRRYVQIVYSEKENSRHISFTVDYMLVQWRLYGLENILHVFLFMKEAFKGETEETGADDFLAAWVSFGYDF